MEIVWHHSDFYDHQAGKDYTLTEYRPNKWLIVKVDSGKGHHYRVFGTWSGGYLDGDSWRVNSGIERVEVEDDRYLFHGSSGSVYACHKEAYGSTGYGFGTLEGIISANEKRNINVMILDEDEMKELVQFLLDRIGRVD